MRRLGGVLGGAAAVLITLGLWPGMSRAGAEDDAAKPEFYTTRVQPILQSNCYRCHGGMNRRGGLNMATRAGMMRGGKNGIVVIPGDPANSLLVRLIRHEGPKGDPMPMPPRAKLSDTDIALVEKWVKAGAIMPADVPKE